MLVPLREEVHLLSLSDILEPLSQKELEELARRNPDIRLKKGEILFTPPDLGERLYIIKEGRIRLYNHSSEGDEVTLALLDKGVIFGEMSLTDQQLREYYAQAEEASLLISLSREALKELIMNKPEVGLRIIERLSQRVRLLQRRLEDASYKKVPARLASLILQLIESEGVRSSEGYQLPAHYTHEQLGAMVGANRVSVTNALSKLRAAGAIELKRRRIHIKDIEALGRLAQEEKKARSIKDPSQND